MNLFSASRHGGSSGDNREETRRASLLWAAEGCESGVTAEARRFTETRLFLQKSIPNAGGSASEAPSGRLSSSGDRRDGIWHEALLFQHHINTHHGGKNQLAGIRIGRHARRNTEDVIIRGRQQFFADTCPLLGDVC